MSETEQDLLDGRGESGSWMHPALWFHVVPNFYPSRCSKRDLAWKWHDCKKGDACTFLTLHLVLGLVCQTSEPVCSIINVRPLMPGGAPSVPSQGEYGKPAG